jgi:hypothetical protein
MGVYTGMADAFSERLAAQAANRRLNPFDKRQASSADGTADGMALHATGWKEKVQKIPIEIPQ